MPLYSGRMSRMFFEATNPSIKKRIRRHDSIPGKIGLSAHLVAAGRELSLVDIDADIDYIFHDGLHVEL